MIACRYDSGRDLDKPGFRLSEQERESKHSVGSQVEFLGFEEMFEEIYGASQSIA